ncbi:MAG: molybdate ABC transporter permease subunit [Chloroflexi bacterium]|nr:molybdate ABC transporter permease subunit [Chloroflexota bacterium]
MAHTLATPARLRAQPGSSRLRPPQEIWQGLALPLLVFLLLPLAALLWRTELDQLWVHLADPIAAQAIRLSLQTTTTSTLLIVLLGTPVAYLLARREFPLRRVVDTLIDLPTVLPPAVAGLGLLMAFGRRGWLGAPLELFGIEIAFTSVAVVLAQVFIASPFYVRAAAGGFASIESELEQAASLDGASQWQVFRFITLPLVRMSLLSGLVMSWARALGDFGATIIFAGNFPGRTQTMPLAIYLGFELDLNVALALSVILIACAFVVLMVVKWLLGEGGD